MLHQHEEKLNSPGKILHRPSISDFI